MEPLTEPEALQARRKLLFEQIAKAADEIKRIDTRIAILKSQELKT